MKCSMGEAAGVQHTLKNFENRSFHSGNEGSNRPWLDLSTNSLNGLNRRYSQKGKKLILLTETALTVAIL